MKFKVELDEFYNGFGDSLEQLDKQVKNLFFKTLKKYVKDNKVTLEFDTDAGTATVLEVK